GGECAYRRKTGEVERRGLDGGPGDGGPDLFARGLAACLAPAGEHHAGAVTGQLGGGGQADAAVRAGDDGGLAGQVGNVVSGPVAHGHTSVAVYETVSYTAEANT